MREDPTRRQRTCATGSATLAMVLMVTACGTKPPVYTDASPPKLQRACQAVDEATGLQMTEIDRAWCRGMMQAWYSETPVHAARPGRSIHRH